MMKLRGEVYDWPLTRIDGSINFIFLLSLPFSRMVVWMELSLRENSLSNHSSSFFWTIQTTTRMTKCRLRPENTSPRCHSDGTSKKVGSAGKSSLVIQALPRLPGGQSENSKISKFPIRRHGSRKEVENSYCRVFVWNAHDSPSLLDITFARDPSDQCLQILHTMW